MPSRKVFNERGFLTKEGATFINDGFVKETRRVIATATNANDVGIIMSILKSLVCEVASAQIRVFNTPQEVKPDLHLVKPTYQNVIPFPSKISSQKLLTLIGAITDTPPDDLNKQ